MYIVGGSEERGTNGKILAFDCASLAPFDKESTGAYCLLAPGIKPVKISGLSPTRCTAKKCPMLSKPGLDGDSFGAEAVTRLSTVSPTGAAARSALPVRSASEASSSSLENKISEDSLDWWVNSVLRGVLFER